MAKRKYLKLAFTLLVCTVLFFLYGPRVGFFIAEKTGFIEIEVLEEQPSPSNEWLATAYTIRGAFAFDGGFFVNVRKNGRNLRHWGKYKILDGYRLQQVELMWASDTDLIISISLPETMKEEIYIVTDKVGDIEIQCRFVGWPDGVTP